jgi:hypothetical protein
MARTPQQQIVDATPKVNITVEETNNLDPQVALVRDISTDLFAYHHKQGASSTVWEVKHGLGFYPNVTILDSGESQIEGELEHLSKNALRVIFSAPISGDAYLS